MRNWEVWAVAVVAVTITVAVLAYQWDYVTCLYGSRLNRFRPDPRRYADRTAAVSQALYVDPNSRASGEGDGGAANPYRTIEAAWARALTMAGSGCRIKLRPGTYDRLNQRQNPEQGDDPIGQINLGGYRGTADHPVVIEAADPQAPPIVRVPINVERSCHVYLINLNIEYAPELDSGGDALHIQFCEHALVRDCVIDGKTLRAPDRRDVPERSHEALKVNQCRHVYVEGCDISGAGDNAVDFVAVQHGHILGNQLHTARSWVLYVKGGSAYILVEGNAIFDGTEGGFDAGQGTDFEYMVAPWIHYEAYAIRFVNNLVFDTDGPGMGVQGGYNVLLAYNTLCRVGRGILDPDDMTLKGTSLVDVGFGERTCRMDAIELPQEAGRSYCDDGGMRGRVGCASNLEAGGWGTTLRTLPGTDTDAIVPIPNRHVYVYNNIIYNPEPARTANQHFNVAVVVGVHPPDQAGVTSNPPPGASDEDLRIRGNLIWNQLPMTGQADQLLGGAPHGCADSNAACNVRNSATTTTSTNSTRSSRARRTTISCPCATATPSPAPGLTPCRTSSGTTTGLPRRHPSHSRGGIKFCRIIPGSAVARRRARPERSRTGTCRSGSRDIARRAPLPAPIQTHASMREG